MKGSFPDSFGSRWGSGSAVYYPLSIFAGHRKDHENDNEAEKEWNPVDIMVPVR